MSGPPLPFLAGPQGTAEQQPQGAQQLAAVLPEFLAYHPSFQGLLQAIGVPTTHVYDHAMAAGAGPNVSWPMPAGFAGQPPNMQAAVARARAVQRQQAKRASRPALGVQKEARADDANNDEGSDQSESDDEDDGAGDARVPTVLDDAKPPGTSRGGGDGDKEHKRLKRLLRNRVSAQQARERKKSYVQNIESRTREYEEKCALLEQRVSTLERENFVLRQVLKSTALLQTAAGAHAGFPTDMPEQYLAMFASQATQEAQDAAVPDLFQPQR